ncbi:unnamed protein product [Echinostoma caproni]|uniref:Uncharacterized protein n=1 Tax=Echinostoma caproni TaxID=27848 RepID=A0A183A4H3_9TREM|nr:unnamed protein product [Echinostoma caproni]
MNDSPPPMGEVDSLSLSSSALDDVQLTTQPVSTNKDSDRDRDHLELQTETRLMNVQSIVKLTTESCWQYHWCVRV